MCHSRSRWSVIIDLWIPCAWVRWLGQDRGVHIKRFCFRDTYEESIVEYHEDIRQGGPAVVDNFFPKEVVRRIVSR